ncbi:MAG: hypothetical protein R3B70_14960 [Polyangiaceae bacterium]
MNLDDNRHTPGPSLDVRPLTCRYDPSIPVSSALRSANERP